MRRAQANRWQYLAVQHRHGEFRALYPLLDQHLRVIAAGGTPGIDQLGEPANLGHADARAFMGGFDDQRKTQGFCRSLAIGLRSQHGVLRRRQAKALPDLLGAQFVHGQGRSQNAAAGVGNAGALQQALHAAIFATTAMQDDEGTIDALAAQALQQVIAGIDAERIHTGLLQCGEHCRAGFQGNFAFGALAPEEYGDTTKRLGVASRMQGRHLDFLAAPSPPNSGLLSSCGARPPISPAPWQSRMSPARSSGLTSGARSTPRST